MIGGTFLNQKKLIMYESDLCIGYYKWKARYTNPLLVLFVFNSYFIFLCEIRFDRSNILQIFLYTRNIVFSKTSFQKIWHLFLELVN